MPFDPETDNRFEAERAKVDARALVARPVSSEPSADPDSKKEALTAEKLATLLKSAVLTAPALAGLDVPQRPELIGKWLREGDLGFVFAPRGVGKTWISMLLANALVEGTALGDWTGASDQPGHRVLYVDGEMNLPDTQWRTSAIGIRSDSFTYLHHEHLYDVCQQTVNLGNRLHQAALSLMIPSGTVLILDNLSALCRGVDENDNDAWEMILPWLLDLRRRQITVIVVHHAGRNGQMRGASRREDAAHWILRIRDDADDKQKALITSFTKCRNCGPAEIPPLRWVLDFTSGLTYTCTRHNGPYAMLSLIAQGVESNADLAEELGISKATVSKWAKKLECAGRITISARAYKLSPEDAGSTEGKKHNADLDD